VASPHGGTVNVRRYWTHVDEKGETQSTAEPLPGPPRPFGIGSTAPAQTEYEERTYSDGTKVLSRWDPAQNAWVQESYDVDPQIRAQWEAGQKTTAPDKPTEVGGKLVKIDPATGKPEVVYAPEPARTPVALDLGAPRPGQKTNLALVEQQYNQFAAQLAADPNLTDEEYNRRLQQYIATYVTPAVQAATEEVNAEAARQVARQQEADRQSAAQEQRAADAATRAEGREERADTAAERTEARSYAEFQQRAGQNAVSNALALLPYRVNPKFLEQYAAGLNVLARGGGAVTFTPDAFQVPLPDLDTLAQQGADRAAAMYRAAGGVPLSPRPAGAGAAAVGPNQPVARTSFPGAPTEPLYPAPVDPTAALEAIPLARRPPQY
jgi:hypothetical protein